MFVAFLGLQVMAGWVLHNLEWVQITPSFRTMKFNTALCFVLSPTALIGLCLKFNRSARLAACVVAVIGSLTILEYITGVNLRIDTLFVTPFTETNAIYAYPGRMVPAAATGLILIGFTLILSSYAKTKQYFSMIIALASSIVVAMGAIPMIEYIFGIPFGYIWGNATEMAMHSAFCFILLGICIIGYTWENVKGAHLWLPVPVCVCLLTISIALSASVYRREDEKFDAMMQSETERLSSVTEAQLAELYNAIGRISNRWEIAGGTPLELWSSDVRTYVRDYKFIVAIEWLDKDLKLQRVEPLQGNEKLIGRTLNVEARRKAAIDKALDTHQPAIADAIDLIQGGKGIIYYHPIYLQAKAGKPFDGIIVAVIRMENFFAPLMERRKGNFYVSIYDGNDMVLSNVPAQTAVETRWMKNAELKSNDRKWRLTLTPTAKLLATKNSLIPLTVLIAGVLTSLLSSLCLYFALKWKLNNKILRLTEMRNEKLIDGVRDYAIYWLDVAGKVESWNRSAERIEGYAAGEIIGKHISIFYTAEDQHAGKPQNAIKTALCCGKLMEEGWRVRKNGKLFWAIVELDALYDDEGRHIGFAKITHDITDRKQAEIALEDLYRLNNAILSNSACMIIATDTQGTVVSFNTAAQDALGYSALEVVGGETPALWHDPEEVTARAEALSAELGMAVEAGFETFVKKPSMGMTYEEEWTFIRKDGTRFPGMLFMTAMHNNSGDIVGFLGIVLDITARKSAEEAQRKLIAKLNESNTELERFAYVASHDMQEPLRMIANFSSVIVDEYADKIDNEGQEYLKLITESALRMQNMVADLLEYARIGKGAVRIADIDVKKEIKHVLVNLSKAIEDRKAQVTYDTLPVIKGIPVQFTSLLQNLISNGLKYQAEDTVPQVHVAAEEEGAFWKFSVKDNGIGMEQAHAAKIFEPFVRLHTWQQYKGTGIGLAVCKKIVENHGGKIWVESEPGKGSVFYFTILKS